MGWFAAIVVVVALVGAGWWLMARATPPAAPAVPAHTDAAASVRVAELWLELAVELCRVDGAIHEREIATLEQALAEGPPGCTPDQAREAVSAALRRPIGPSRAAALLSELASLADARHRAAALAALGEIAGSDGEISADERALLERARSVLGAAPR